MPAPKKPPGKRVDNREDRQGLGVLTALPTPEEHPPARADWSEATKGEWDSYWRSPIAQAIEAGSALGALMRLFDLKDRVARFERAAKDEPLVKGSTGQPILNPLLKEAHAMGAEIRQLEDRFGMSPKACLQLGVAFTGAQRSLEEWNKALASSDQEPEAIEAEVKEADPRTAAN